MASPARQQPQIVTDALQGVRALLARAGAASFFVNLLMLTGPIYMLQIYDRVLSSRSVETLAVVTFLILILFAAMAGLDFARGAMLSRIASAFEDKLKQPIFNASMEAARLGVPGAEQPIKDLRQVRQFVASPALAAVFDAPWTPLFLLIIFLMHPVLGLVALTGLIVLLGLAIINERVSREATLASMKKTAAADQIASAALRNAGAADAMGMRSVLRKRWLAYSNEAGDESLMATDAIGGLTALSKSSRLFLQSAILGTGAFLAIQGAVTPGVMIAASIITGRALAPIEVITSQWRQFATTFTAYRRLKDFIALAPPEKARTELPAPKGALSAEKVF
ncbi:MAG: ABC transporter transmembrane domain-containing protein, partial [Pseudomonadota bacterium]